jgi:hypothetical protein
MKTVSRIAPYLTVGAALVQLHCGSSNNSVTQPLSPTPPPAPASAFSISSFVSGLSGADGSQGSVQTGQAPQASNGPAATPTANSGIVRGGTSQVRLQSTTAFQTVYMFVSGVSGGVGGFWQLRLASPTTDASVFPTFATQVPASSFDLMFGVASASGAVGTFRNLPTQVLEASSGDIQVSVSWDARSDVDLHVVDPSGEEVYWENPSARSGGQLDLDSNAACDIDGKNNENIRWTPIGPAGSYTVRVDYWDACSVGQTNYVVTVKNGASTQVFRGNFTGPGDQGSRGSGRSITTFSHSSSLTITQLFDWMRPRSLFVPSAEKRRLSGQQR